MKLKRTYLIAFIIMLLTLNIYSQNPIDSSSVKRTEATFNGDISGNEFIKFLSKTLEYPNTKNLLNGRVIAQFEVDTFGNVMDIKILRGLRVDYDQKVIAAIMKSPKWIPATENGKKVAEKKVIPVIFHK
jgi:hypothetical protein